MSAPQPEAAVEAPQQPAPPVPVVEAEGLSLVGPEGPVFTDVSLAVLPARATLLVGSSGTGRSTLLLALTGRMRGTTGTLRQQGREIRSGRGLKNLRRATSVARASTFVVPEARLSVAESVSERALLDGVRPAAALHLHELRRDGPAVPREVPRDGFVVALRWPGRERPPAACWPGDGR